MKNPQMIIIGGANGCGKTTFARELVLSKGLNYLGADDIAFQLNPTDFDAVKIEAARLFSKKLLENLEQHKSFVVESTLAGLSFQKSIKLAQNLGFEIRIFFVYLDSVELCLQRIKSRVANGGHFVPEKDVRRRYFRANENFENIYKDLADKWTLVFNANDDFRQIAVSNNKSVIILDEERFEIWQKMVKK